VAITRRDLISSIAKTGVPAAIAVSMGSEPLHAESASSSSAVPLPSAAVGLLYDATICIGCKACVAGCAEANGTAPDTRGDGLHQAPTDLNEQTRNIIKLYKPSDGSPASFVKRQCMQCLDPACAAGCPFQALHKDPETGIVTWTANKCIGCRYCTITCPYHVPRFQWQGYNPIVTKCELCSTRLENGLKPGCTTVCPTGAVIYGPRTVLLTEAKRRIRENPRRYYQNKVYGETDNGGTQALYLSRVPFEDLGLPELGKESIPERTLRWQKRLYQYFALPALLYVGLVQVIRKSLKGHEEEAHERERETGLRAQL
jgi:Fe-S-cluster-containing dehydrogenase component